MHMFALIWPRCRTIVDIHWSGGSANGFVLPMHCIAVQCDPFVTKAKRWCRDATAGKTSVKCGYAMAICM